MIVYKMFYRPSLFRTKTCDHNNVRYAVIRLNGEIACDKKKLIL